MDPYDSLTRNIIQSEIRWNQKCLTKIKFSTKKSCEYFKIHLNLHVKSDELFLKAPLLELYLARIENIPEFVIKFSTG